MSISHDANVERKLRQAEKRRGEKWRDTNGGGWGCFALLGYLLVFSVAGAFVQQAFLGVLKLPSFAATPTGAAVLGIATLVVGAGFYLLREHYRLVYALCELGAAAGTGYGACQALTKDGEKGAWVLAIFGAIYVAVRGYDNLAKAVSKPKPKKNSQVDLAFVDEQVRNPLDESARPISCVVFEKPNFQGESWVL